LDHLIYGEKKISSARNHTMSRIAGSLTDYRYLIQHSNLTGEWQSPHDLLNVPAFRFWGCVLLALIPAAYLLLPNPFH